ncbi:hypothetical protein [Marinibacterium profundimaris]|nr:hypothetical protein [Marinibacterium profundimaris]
MENDTPGARLDGPRLLLIIVFGCFAVLMPYALAGEGAVATCAMEMQP